PLGQLLDLGLAGLLQFAVLLRERFQFLKPPTEVRRLRVGLGDLLAGALLVERLVGGVISRLSRLLGVLDWLGVVIGHGCATSRVVGYGKTPPPGRGSLT